MATIETTDVIASDVIAKDRKLTNVVRRADGSLKSAKDQRADAHAELNQYRWEMTVCEHGPQYSQREYAGAVGVSPKTIERSVTAWHNVLDKNKLRQDDAVCAYGGKPHDQAEPVKPTPQQVEDNDAEKRIATVGEVNAAAIDMLAVHFGIAKGTITSHHRARIAAATGRLRERHDTESMSIVEITNALNVIAHELFREFKLEQRRLGDIQRWMKSNRAQDEDITVADARKMYARIERRMEAKDWTWEMAEAEVRQNDWARCEVERTDNELLKAARMAVLDLRQSAARMKTDAVKLGEAMRRIWADNIPISDDELELVTSDLTDAADVVKWSLATVTGTSNTDWDAALTGLLAGDES